MTSGNPMEDDQDRDNDPTSREQRDIEITHELADLHKQLKQSQDVISEEEATSEKLQEQIEALENERDTLYDSNEVEE